MPPKTKAKAKGRVMILLHEKSGCYSDYTLQPDATDAHFAKLASEHSGRTAILSKVCVHLLTPESHETRVEAVAKELFGARLHREVSDKWEKAEPVIRELYTRMARAALSALGLAKR